MRDLLVTAVIFGLLPLCFLRPWMGVLVWCWIGYMNPHRLCWGFATKLPFAEMVGILTLAGLPFCTDRYRLPRKAEVFLLAALWAVFLLSTLFVAIQPDAAWQQFEKVSKIFLMTFLTLLLFQNERRLRALIWVIVVSFGFFSFKGGIFVLLTGGQYHVLGPPNTFFGDNNNLALAMDMIIPMLVFLRREARAPWLRHFLLLWSLLTIVAIIGTYSRGGFLGLLVVLAFLFRKSRSKTLAVAVAIVVGLATALLAPEKWTQRMQSIETYQQVQTANQRLNSWYVSYRLALDHPFLGAGFRPFSTALYEHYIPGYRDKGYDAHSIFFQVLAEHGFTGLALYVCLILTTLLSLRQVRRTALSRGRPEIGNYADMVEASVVAYIAAGLFASMSYFDLFYHLVAIAVLLKVLVAQPSADAVGMSTVTAPGTQGALATVAALGRTRSAAVAVAQRASKATT